MDSERRWAAAVSELDTAVDGTAVLPGNPGAELDRFNLATPFRPSAVVTASGVADILATIRFAADRAVPLAVQATGHGSVPVTGDTVVLNTRRRNGIRVDPATRTARIEPGVRSGALIREAATFGLAPLNGASPLVGTVGYTLGGGHGPLGRAYGYAADLVRELDIVTADGEFRTTAPDREPELFWAARGGKGNVGVVTSMTLDLVPVTRLYGGGIYVDAVHAADVLHAYREWTADAPDELSSSVALLRLPPLDVIPEPLRGRFVVHLRIAYLGTAADGAKLVAPLRDAAPILVDTVTEMPYADVARIHQDPVDPGPYHERSGALRELTKSTVDTILDVAGPGTDYPGVSVELRHLGGALARTPDRPNAIPYREAAFSVFTVGIATGESVAPLRDAQRGLLDALSPWRLGGPFLSFLGPAEATPHEVEAAFDADTYRRLRTAKTHYDPHNLFRRNHNIPPLP